MSVVDKLDAARHSITGSNLAKIACKATSREVMGPKRKHIDYLIQCTNTDNVSIPNLADILFERCTNSSWVVVFKSLCTFHHLMSYGNGRFIQYMASSTTCFSLQNFLDKSGVQGYDMSTFVRRYSNYLNEKASSYREMGYDFCRVKRGKQDGVLRTFDSTKLLQALPVLQKQIDAILEVDVKSTELSNGVINCAFVLLFKDLIRLFACYNDGIINLLEKYFDMNKKECKAGLEIYKRFVTRMDRVQDFLKTAEDVGFEKEDIPDLSKAPNSLLDALENHYQALEKGKTTSSHKPLTIPAITVPKLAADAFSSSGFGTGFEESSTTASIDKKKQLIEEEERRMEAFKAKKNISSGVTLPSATFAAPVAAAAAPPKATTPSDDLLQLDASFASSIPQQPTNKAFSPSTHFPPSQPFPGMQPGGMADFGPSPWGNAPVSAPSTAFQTSTAPNFFDSPAQGSDADFDKVFGGSAPVSSLGTASNTGVLKPVAADNAAPNLVTKQQTQDDSAKGTGDLMSSLERVTKSLDNLMVINGGTSPASKKGQHQWTPAQPQQKTGGPNWQKQNLQPARSTVPPAQVGWGAGPQQGMYRPPFGQPAMPTGMPQRMGGNPAMFPSAFGSQPSNLGQPQQPSDPFGPIPGSQARF
ncbi:phosphatidylinositol-binding clathrin assembly protein LAP-like [Actinia tenebrosa]|uniref:Phosphatidylinositol-binding clathrin assembly protein LAP-like n=1 Tax=Actinia tenebrosa TaxID=6105 RepID=A0A6P8HNZ9_ACTTE|nr:phosphatidylinositol-binding clathrin assembly protein LAP-like [Actinia tenebrosa]